jgi:hypothetical protein
MIESVRVARGEMERRLAEMNEFRAQILMERKDFMSTKEYDVKHEFLRARIEKLEQSKSNLDGRFWALGTGLGILTVVVNIIIRLWAK